MDITDNRQLSAFRVDFMMAVAELQEKYDVTISLGPISYTENQFTTKMTVDNGRDRTEIERANFDMNVWKYRHLGLEPGMYGRVFVANDGRKYAILGFNTKAPKYPLIIMCTSTNERCRAPERFIKELLNEYYVENSLL